MTTSTFDLPKIISLYSQLIGGVVELRKVNKKLVVSMPFLLTLISPNQVRRALYIVVIVVFSAACSTSTVPSQPGSTAGTTLILSDRADTERLVLFVHGLFGDSTLTWTSPTGIAWPDLMQTDTAFRQYTIGRVRYESPRFARTSGVEEIATRLLRHLEDRGVFQKYKEIYFITHSMGGLVVKRVLVDLHRPSQIDKLRRVKAILLISVPSQGATIAELGSWLSRNPQIPDLRAADLNSFLQGLENQWQDLLRDRGQDTFPLSFCAYETKPTVSRVYAATSCDQNPVPVDADHSGIVKPGNRDADIYRWAQARIQQTSELFAARLSQAATGKEEQPSSPPSQIMTNSPGGIQAGGNITIQQGPSRRVVTAQQRETLIRVLRRYRPATISILKIGDREAQAYAHQIGEVIQASGWKVELVNFAMLMPGVYGVYSLIGDPTINEALMLAFKTAGVEIALGSGREREYPNAILVGLQP